MSIALSVNLNKVALLRNSRTDNNPDIERFAERSIDSGAKGLTAHPRPDQRHIRPGDIHVLAKVANARGVEFNIEGNPFADAVGSYPGLLTLVKQACPDQCTLVPDANEQLTSDHGFDLVQDGARLAPIIRELKALGVRISLFMDPIPKQIQLASELGADRIELYTGPFALAYAKSTTTGAASASQMEAIFKQHCDAAELAHSLGLGVNAGHDLNLSNMIRYRELPHLKEVSIGHALTADALEMGFSSAVQAYSELCRI